VEDCAQFVHEPAIPPRVREVFLQIQGSHFGYVVPARVREVILPNFPISEISVKPTAQPPSTPRTP
jgi:hypothetical protein